MFLLLYYVVYIVPICLFGINRNCITTISRPKFCEHTIDKSCIPSCTYDDLITFPIPLIVKTSIRCSSIVNWIFPIRILFVFMNKFTCTNIRNIIKLCKPYAVRTQFLD